MLCDRLGCYLTKSGRSEFMAAMSSKVASRKAFAHNLVALARSPLIPQFNSGSTFALRFPHSRLLSRWAALLEGVAVKKQGIPCVKSYSGNDCVKSLRSSYTGLYPQTRICLKLVQEMYTRFVRGIRQMSTAHRHKDVDFAPRNAFEASRRTVALKLPRKVWPSTLNPFTLHPTPSTLHPQPSTLNSTPYTLNPRPLTLNSKPDTPTPKTLNPPPKPNNQNTTP